MRRLALAALAIIACDRPPPEAVREAGKLLQEDVLCSGGSDGCAGAGDGYTCIGRHTGREVYCSADNDGRCVIVEGVGFGRTPAVAPAERP